MAGGDVSKMKEKHVKIVESYGATDLDRVRTFETSVATMLSSFKETPTDAEKTDIVQKSTDVQNNLYLLVTTKPGLENSLTDSNLKSKPENREFYQLIDESNLYLESITADPASAHQNFTTDLDKYAKMYAHYAFVVEDFIKQNKVGKLIFKHLIYIETSLSTIT
jgi:hypothetical protein